MSDYESHKGRLVLIKRLEEETDLDYFNRATEKNVYEKDFESIRDAIYELDLYEEYFYVKDKLYKNEDHEKLDPYNDVQELKGDEVNGYTYFMKFYNGGTCLSEMVEESLEKISAKK